MIHLTDYVARFTILFSHLDDKTPWDLTKDIQKIISEMIGSLQGEYEINNGVAIHKTASVDRTATVKAPAIISANCFVGAHAYLRGGIFLDEHVSIGPGCELKSSFVFSHSALAHFNFIGDSMLGSHVNLEAGAVVANHFNERKTKEISVLIDGKRHPTGMQKFGALVGDHTKIGANAVLSPGTILKPEAIVKRLQLIDQSE
jgi:bifunctional N-acetylglucosamine-1-phosphate-uridyltransferase/glucosamine-1-phosphate-acetyltransferase GlmU-like protein